MGWAGVGYGVAEVDKNHPGMCWVREKAKAFPPGTSWPMDDFCGVLSCDERRGKLYVQFTTCGRGKVGSYPVCHHVANTSASYPKCCPIEMCVTPEQLEIIIKEGGYEIISP